jgi:hypothetical protein
LLKDAAIAAGLPLTMAGEPGQHTTITVPQIARRLDVCEETVYAMLKAHEIPNLRHIKADPDVIEEFYRIADAQGWFCEAQAARGFQDW